MSLSLATTRHGKFYYWPQDDIGKCVAKGEFWDAHFRSYMDALGPDDTMMDVGANIGFFSVYCALIRKARVVAFEPSPECFQVLTMNVVANEIQDRVSLNQVALYDREVELRLNPEWDPEERLADGRIDYDRLPNSGGLSLVFSGGQTNNPYRFVSRTLDSYGLDTLRLLKIDTQGADVRILAGAQQTIARCRPTICFEVESVPARLHGDSFESAFNLFADLNYEVRAVLETVRGYSDFVAQPR